MPHIISKIHRLADVLENEIDSKQIFYFTSSWDIDTVYEKYAVENNWDKRINVVAADFVRYTTHRPVTHFHNAVEYKVHPREKKFLCFNKLNREHRMVLLEKLLPTGLVNQSYYSFEGSHIWKQEMSLLRPDEFPNIQAIKNSIPMRLNITESRTNPVDIRYDDYKYFENSNFSVVTETLFYSYNTKTKFHKAQVLDSIFITEKVYRCFVLCHPFILLSRPKSLYNLRQAGYQTFSPYIDESYDDVEDDNMRLKMVFNEIIRLSKLPEEQMLEFQKAVKPIVDYNHQHFFNKTDCRITDLVKYFN